MPTKWFLSTREGQRQAAQDATNNNAAVFDRSYFEEEYENENEDESGDLNTEYEEVISRSLNQRKSFANSAEEI
jgi:hypothetical protein